MSVGTVWQTLAVLVAGMTGYLFAGFALGEDNPWSATNVAEGALLGAWVIIGLWFINRPRGGAPRSK